MIFLIILLNDHLNTREMDSEIQERIEMYVRGKLNDEEENDLWILFLQSAEWYDYFNTYLNLMGLARKR